MHYRRNYDYFHYRGRGIYALTKAVHNVSLVFIVSIMIGNLFQLMVSGSYIDDKIFWLSIGFLLSQYKRDNGVITAGGEVLT